MSDQFETRLATVVRTAVAEAPPAPSVADILAARRARPHDQHRGRNPWLLGAAGVAAAAALLAALVLTHRPSSSEQQDSAVGSGSSSPRLAQHALPSSLPEGWTLVDIAESETSRGVIPAAQLFRRVDDGAVVRLQIQTPNDAPQDTAADSSATTAAQAVPSAERQTLEVDPAAPISTFHEAGTSIYVDQAGVSPADTETFLRQLDATGTGANLRYSSPDPNWKLEAGNDRIDAADQTEPFGVLVFRNDAGASFYINFFPASGTTDPFARFGVPERRSNVALYVSGTSASRLLGDTIAYTGSFDPTVMKVAVDALASLTVVDFTEWSVAADELAADASNNPPLAELTVGNVEVSTHLSHGALAVCANLKAVTRCHEAPGSSDATDPEHHPFELSFDVAGRFVHVISNHANSGTDFSITRDDSTTALTSTKRGNTFIVAAVARPEATTMTVSIKSDGETGTYTATRPSL